METYFLADNVETFVLVLVRLSAFVFTAPFLSQKGVPRKVKVGIAVILSIIAYEAVGKCELNYSGSLGYAVLVAKEAVCGLMLGFACNVCTMILAFAGNIMDMEIGFSMMQGMNPMSGMLTTVSGDLYTYFVMIVLLIMNVHLYVVSAIIESFEYIKLGNANIEPSIYKILVNFIVAFFVIAFRIVLPIFAVMLLINVVLGILAKVASQMNLFVVGMQLKILVGLIVLIFISGTIPLVADFIFEQMKEMVREFVKALK